MLQVTPLHSLSHASVMQLLPPCSTQLSTCLPCSCFPILSCNHSPWSPGLELSPTGLPHLGIEGAGPRAHGASGNGRCSLPSLRAW